jgi:hypothetical protein
VVTPNHQENTANGNENHELGTGDFFLCIRESYQQLRVLSLLLTEWHNIILRDRWCHIIVLNVHALTEDKIYVKGQLLQGTGMCIR